MLLLVDLQLLNISNGTSVPTRSPSSPTLEETITALGDAVSNGDLSRIPVQVNETEVILEVSSVGQCGDTLCRNDTNVIPLATAPPPTTPLPTTTPPPIVPAASSVLKAGESTVLLCVLAVVLLKVYSQ
jgi:hypothetical protein